MKARVLFWLALYAVYLCCMPATFYFEDSPELVACSFVLGNTHPPGYPLLVLLGRLAQTVPVGSLAFRFNLLIAACGAGAATLLGVLVSRLATELWSGSKGALAAAAGGLAAGSWAFSDAFWWEAEIGDKYPPYYFLFLLVLLMGCKSLVNGSGQAARRSILLSLGAGICFAFHFYAIFALPIVGLAFVRLAVGRERDARIIWPRALLLGAALGILPISTRIIFPPMRSAAATELDWGRPKSAARLLEYLSGKLYRGSFTAASIPGNAESLDRRVGLSLRLLNEEIPLGLLIGIPAGFYFLCRRHPWLLAGLGASALCNWLYAMNFTEKVVRWYEPAYAILLAISAVGFLWVARKFRARATAVLVALAVLGAGWQLGRGQSRCNLSGFYAAHDFAGNLLVSLPPGSIYLGAGDFDLFPLWAIHYCEGARPDVEAIGLASFLDPRLAGAGSQARLISRFGLPADARQALAQLLSAPGRIPVMIAPAGYDARIYEQVPVLVVQQTRGLAGRFQRHWDAPGSFMFSRLLNRAYSYRGLCYAQAGALADLVRPRDEVARGALLQYPVCFSVLARQGFRFNMQVEGAWAFKIARRQMEALVGPLGRGNHFGATGIAPAQADRFLVVEGFQRLADLFERRGIPGLAGQYRECARAISE